MKKVLACLVIVAFLVGVSGCAGTSFLCKNKDSVLAGLQLVISQATATITAIEAAYPGVMPAIALAALQAAQQAKNIAEDAAAKACPTATDLSAAQNEMVYSNQLKIMATMNELSRKK